MVRLSVKAWLAAPIMVCMLLGLAMSAKAEIRGKSSAATPQKSMSKDQVKMKSAKKGTPDSKSTTGSRSGRPRNGDPPLNQQGIVAPDLDLEPET